MFCDENENGSNDGVVLKLKKSLYELVQAPRSWYHHLQAGLTKLDFEPSTVDARMYYGRGMILITYVEDTLFFGPDLKNIEQTIYELEGLGYGLTREEGDKTAAFFLNSQCQHHSRSSNKIDEFDSRRTNSKYPRRYRND